MSTIIEAIAAVLSNGSQLPMRSHTSKYGNEKWGVLDRKADGTRYFNTYGVPLSSKLIGEKVPTAIQVLGQEFKVEQQIDEETSKPEVNAKGKPVFRAEGPVTVPNRGKKHFSFRITVVEDGSLYNVSAQIRGVSEGGAKRHVLDDDL